MVVSCCGFSWSRYSSVNYKASAKDKITQMDSCCCRYGCNRLVGQFHHVNIIAFAAKSLYIGCPTQFSEIEGHDEALEFSLVVYFNMVEPFGSSLYWLMVWESQG